VLVAYLRMISDRDPFSSLQLAEVAKSIGLTFEYPNFGSLYNPEGVKRGWAIAARLLDEADAFILDGLPLEEDSAQRFHERVRSGARALIFAHHGDRESLRWWWDFLQPYYIRPSWVKLVGPHGERAGLIFTRQENCFRDPELFAGVDAVVADTPFALWYGGEAWPVLVGSPSHWGVEAPLTSPTIGMGEKWHVWPYGTGKLAEVYWSAVRTALSVIRPPFLLEGLGRG